MICRRCHQWGEHKARGLCRNCYQTLIRLGLHTMYPLTTGRPDTPDVGYCFCPDGQPIERVYGMALQCGTCQRKVFAPDEEMPARFAVLDEQRYGRRHHEADAGGRRSALPDRQEAVPGSALGNETDEAVHGPRAQA